MTEKDQQDAPFNYRTFLQRFIGKPAYLAVRGDYYELCVENPDRENEYELTSQANMESSLYKIIGAHDDFVLLLEDIPQKREFAISYAFLKKIQVIL